MSEYLNNAKIAADIGEVLAERDALRAQLAAVEALHAKVYEQGSGIPRCRTCPGNGYPCPTVAALHPASSEAPA